MFYVSADNINKPTIKIDSKSILLKLINQFILDETESNKSAIQ